MQVELAKQVPTDANYKGRKYIKFDHLDNKNPLNATSVASNVDKITIKHLNL